MHFHNVYVVDVHVRVLWPKTQHTSCIAYEEIITLFEVHAAIIYELAGKRLRHLVTLSFNILTFSPCRTCVYMVNMLLPVLNVFRLSSFQLSIAPIWQRQLHSMHKFLHMFGCTRTGWGVYPSDLALGVVNTMCHSLAQYILCGWNSQACHEGSTIRWLITLCNFYRAAWNATRS